MSGQATPRFKPKEWNAGGTLHLSASQNSRSYVIEVTLDADVEEGPLQEGVDKTLQRMPYYAQTFVRKRGAYFYAENDLPMTVAHTSRLRQLGTQDVNWHMMDVTYDGRVISFSAAHALADGWSFTNFVQTVMYYYFCAKDGRAYSSDGIVTLDTPVRDDELVDPFAQKRKFNLTFLKSLKGVTRAILPENKVPYPQDHRSLYPLQIATDALLGWAKDNGSSPAAAISALIAKVIARENPTLEDSLEICIQTSLRQALGVPHTLKNCVGIVHVPFDKKTVGDAPAGELAGYARKELRAQMTAEIAENVAGIQYRIYKIVKAVPIRAIRSKIMFLIADGLFNTVSVDYAGRLAMGEYADHVQGVSYYLSEVFQGSLYLIVSECAGKFRINFNQSFDTDRYYRAFLALLDEEGIPYETLPAVRYLTPEVVIPGQQA